MTEVSRYTCPHGGTHLGLYEASFREGEKAAPEIDCGQMGFLCDRCKCDLARDLTQQLVKAIDGLDAQIHRLISRVR